MNEGDSATFAGVPAAGGVDGPESAVSEAFERLYLGARRDLSEALRLLEESDQFRADLTAELEQLRNRRIVRFADAVLRASGSARRNVRGQR